MKISYEEFNELQRQQKIRDYTINIYHALICLEQVVERNDKKQIRDIMPCILSVNNKAIKNIQKMISGDEDDN